MKKAIKLLLLVVAVLSPTILPAQTSDEQWIRLADLMKERKYSGLWPKYQPSSDELEDQIIINKIAYKKTDRKKNIRNYSGGRLCLQKIDGMNGTIPIYSSEASVSPYFDLNINGKKIKSKEITTNDEGWKIYEFDDLMRISSIGSFTEILGYSIQEEDSGYDLLDYIYVSLGDISGLASQKRNTIIKEAYENLFITPQEKGWTPENSETLSDGTIIEHYREGVRTYKKPNGDFATFFEPDDKRNPKTLDLINGKTLSPDSASNPIGAFRITQPNGLIVESDGIYPSFIFNDGSKMNLMDRSKSAYYQNYKDMLNEIVDAANGQIKGIDHPQKDIISNYAKMNADKFKGANDKIAYFPFFDITFTDFIDPQDNFIMEKDGNYGSRHRDKRAYDFEYVEPNGETKHPDFFFFPYRYGQKIFRPTTMSIWGMNDDLVYEGISIEYDPSSKNINDTFLESYILFDNNKRTKVKYDYIIPNNNNRIYAYDTEFENGDRLIVKYDPQERFIIDDDGTILTLPNGTKLENIEGKYKITHPDGSSFVGSIIFGGGYPRAIDFYNKYLSTGEFKYDTGILTKADGKEFNYKGGTNLEEFAQSQAEEKRIAAEKQKALMNSLISKYGKSNVEQAANGNIREGMSIEMLVELGLPLVYNNSNSTYSWYKLIVGLTDRKQITGSYKLVTQYRMLKVNKSTGKITYIGTVQTGY